MRFLDNKSIASRLLLIAAVPASVAVLFAGFVLIQLGITRSEASDLADGTALAVQVGNVVHDLQRERGFSVGFTSSNGAKFASELRHQRLGSDRQIAALKASGGADDLQSEMAQLSQVAAVRSDMDRHALKAPDLAARYTAIINSLIDAIERRSTLHTSNTQAKIQAAFIQVVRGKEAAGLERAMGANGLAAGRFAPATYQAFVGFRAVQDAAFRRLRELLPSEQRATLDGLLSDHNARILDSYRDAISDEDVAGESRRLDPAVWWNAASARIDALKTLENALASRMIENAKTSRARADTLLVITALVLLAIGAVLYVFLRRVTASIKDPLRQIRATAEAIANGELIGQPIVISGDNELSELGRSISELRIQLRAAAEAKEEQTKMIVESVGASLAALAEGDLTHRVTAELNGPFALLKTNFNAAGESLRTLIGATLRSADAIQSGASEIAQASTDLARRTERNAATLEETAAALAEVEARVTATAASSTETLRRADDAISTVHRGRTITNAAVQSMGRVSDSARDIDLVIEGLDKIAFQTRVLAMNAAVEAGRAGEAGRGFAVVADLVSALAMRAEEEAKRAREQLTVTQAGVASAVGAVRDVDSALDAIAEGVAAVYQLIGATAAHNCAQSESLGQITNAVAEVDRVTQQNAAMVEQTSAAASNLSGEVDLLVSQANQFNVEEGADRHLQREDARRADHRMRRSRTVVAA